MRCIRLVFRSEVLSTVGLLAVAGSAWSQYSFPPGSTAPIQALLSGPALPPGTTITLSAGTYTGTLDFAGQPVTIQGAGPLATIIDGNSTPGRVITFQNAEGPNSILKDVAVRQGAGGGILVDSVATPRIENCIVRENQASRGAGILVFSAFPSGPNAAIVNCKFYSNTASQAGGGAAVSGAYSGGPSALFVECEFIDNDAPLGGGVYIEAAIAPTFERCVVADNSAGVAGGGAYWFECASPTFIDCDFSFNEAVDGGGLAFERPGPSLVLHCTLAGNRAVGSETGDGRGGGIFGFGESSNCDTELELHNLLFFENLAGIGGAGYFSNLSPRMSYVTSTGNVGNSVGGFCALNTPGVLGDCSNLEFRSSILWGNLGLAVGSSDPWSKELWAQTCAPVVHTCDVEGSLSSPNPPSAWITTNLQEHDPHFVTGYTCKIASVGGVFLSQAPLQSQPWSRCVNAGPGPVSGSWIAGRTTRTDGVADSGRPDLGFHYPSPCP